MTLWFDRLPGDNSICDDVSEKLLGPDDPGGAVLVHGGRPDWVQRPDTGEKLKVFSVVQRKLDCPSCQEEVIAKVHVLEKSMYVVDCPSCSQFVWFQL